MSSIINRRSPGVDIKEMDTTNFTSAQESTRGGSFVDAEWGEAWTRVNVSSTDAITSYFGKSNNRNYVSWLSAAAYVKHSANLDLVRAIDENAINSDDTGKGILIENRVRFSLIENSPELSGSMFAARCPGELGDSIKVVVIDSTNWAELPREYKSLFDIGPTTSPNIARMAGEGANDEIHVLVLDAKGKFTGVVNATLEIYPHLSKSRDAIDGDNLPTYYRDVINGRSKYIYAIDLPAKALMGAKYKELETITAETRVDQVWTKPVVQIDGDGKGAAATITLKTTSGRQTLEIEVTDPGTEYTYYDIDIFDADNILNIPINVKVTYKEPDPAAEIGDEWGTPILKEDGSYASYSQLVQPIQAQLFGGRNTERLSEDQIIRALQIASTGEISYLYIGDGGGDRYWLSVAQAAIDLCDGNKKMLACISFPQSIFENNQTNTHIVENILALRKRLARTSSYFIIDDNWGLINDPNSTRDRWIPMNAITAGLWARVDIRANFWNSAAGLELGLVSGVKQLKWASEENDRNDLYPQSVNSYINHASGGIILFGDNTGQIRNSAFKYVGVRKLFIIMRKVFGENIQSVLFKDNNIHTRKLFVKTAESWLKHIAGRGGLYTDDGGPGFFVWCDHRNNDETVVQGRGFNAMILVKPVYSVNFIELTLTAVDYNIDFEEIIRNN